MICGASTILVVKGLMMMMMINGLAEKKELAKSVEHLDKASTAYSMEISTEKTKLMTNNTSGIDTKIKVNGQKHRQRQH